MGGSSSLHPAAHRAHLGAKGHPGEGLISSGGAPSMVYSRSPLSPSSRGEAAFIPAV